MYLQCDHFCEMCFMYSFAIIYKNENKWYPNIFTVIEPTVFTFHGMLYTN